MFNVTYVFNTKEWLVIPSLHDVIHAHDPSAKVSTDASVQAFQRKWNECSEAQKPVLECNGALPTIPGVNVNVLVRGVLFWVDEVSMRDGEEAVRLTLHPYGRLELAEWRDRIDALLGDGWRLAP